MYNPFTLEGKTILVTGASSGIGRQCAIDCSRMGARVVLVARNEERLRETLSLMEGEGHVVSPFDLNYVDDIKNLISDLTTTVIKFDGMIHAAGIERTKPIKLLTASDYDEVFRTNAMSGFEIVRNISGQKSMNIGGSIVMISSITSCIGRNGVAAYAASKGAINSAVRVMALELAARKIRVNAVSPGTILTPMMQNYLATLTTDDYKKRIAGFPLGLGMSTDVSNACIYLLSDASRWVTGQNLIVDGGYTVR